MNVILCMRHRLAIPALDGSISLKFLLKARLEPESLEPLIDFLGSRSKSYCLETTNYLVNPIIRQLIDLLFLGHNFRTRNARKLIKTQTTRILAWFAIKT